MIFDFFKHLSTLNSACILLMAGLVERVFANPLNDWKVDGMFWGFVLSLFGSLIVMACMMFGPSKEGSERWAIILLVAFLLAVTGFVVALGFAHDVIAAQRAARHAILQYEGKGYAESDGTYVYSVSNRSTDHDYTITKMDFIISDPKELAEIGKVHSRPLSATAPCVKYDRNGYFYDGCWRGNSYVFGSVLETVVPKAGDAAIRLRIANRRYGERWMKGQVVFHYDGQGSPLKIEGVSIKASPQFDTSTPKGQTQVE